MVKIERISIGGIESLVEKPIKIYYLGESSFKSSSFFENRLTVRTPNETRRINTDYSLIQAPRDQFLDVVETYLKENKLYLAEANYRPQIWGGFLPHKLEGILYKEIEQEEEKSKKGKHIPG